MALKPKFARSLAPRTSEFRFRHTRAYLKQMSVDKDTVRRIAKLARLALDDAQAADMEKELNALLSWVEQLSDVNVDGVAPMTSVVEQRLKMRDDAVTDGGYPDDLMKNAPQVENHFFVVPKVVE